MREPHTILSPSLKYDRRNSVEMNVILALIQILAKQWTWSMKNKDLARKGPNRPKHQKDDAQASYAFPGVNEGCKIYRRPQESILAKCCCKQTANGMIRIIGYSTRQWLEGRGEILRARRMPL